MQKHEIVFFEEPNKSAADDLLERGRHIGLGSIFGTVSNKADTLWLRASAGLEQVGIYGAAYRVIGGMQLVATSCSLALYPGLTRGEHRAKLGYMIAAPLGAVSLLLASAIIPEPLVLLVYGQAYAEAVPVLTVLLLAGVAQWIHAWAARWVIATHKERALPRAQAVGCATLLVGLATLTPTMGAMGAAWATFAADWLGLVTLAVSVRRLKQ